MTVNLSGVIVAAISAALGGGAMVAAPSLGISEGNALPFGLLAGGIVACVISWYQTVTGSPNTIFLPMWLWGTGAAIVGVLGMIGVVPLGSGPSLSAEQIQRLDSVSEKLKRETVSASKPGYLESARRLHGALGPTAKKVGGGDKLSLYLELDAPAAKRATMFLRVDDPRRLTPDGTSTLLTVSTKLLQSDYPTAVCHVALRGPSGWLGQAQTGPNRPLVPTVDDSPPDF